MSKLLVCCCIFLLAACETGSAPGDPARLTITQHQTACCYTEGQVSFLEVTDATGAVFVRREFVADELIYPVVDQRVPAGTYTLRSWQRPCNGNCGRVDAPVNECTASFTVAAAGTLFVTASFAPRAGCALTQTAEPLASPPNP